ncbi:MAG: glycoside hydrolase family 15 protein [Acidobacteria bacterium]|nr:glycoside hydrolase family 15 protein [Acidobacteriota bacterium]
MARTLPIANGRLHLSFDQLYRVRDIYHRHLGLNNQTGGVPWRLGVWVDGALSWVQDEGWRRELRYEAHDSPITEARLTNESLGIEMVANDAVAPDCEAFVRRIRLTNLSDEARDIRLFLNSRFRIEDNADSVTVFYAPDRRAIVHYKSDHWFSERGTTEGAGVIGVGQFTCGEACHFGTWGTWQDAADGWLEGNPVAQGDADATICFGTAREFGEKLAAGETATINYWLAAGSTYEDVRSLDEQIAREGVGSIIERAREAARAFLSPARRDFSALPDNSAANLYHRSLLTLSALADENGAIVAAADSAEQYGYVWPRDAAFVANALDRAGLPEIPRRFFRFIARAARERPWLWQKYNADGTLGASWHPWVVGGAPALPVQEDETGLVLWALAEHCRLYDEADLLGEVYESLVARGADWMVEYRDGRTKLPLPSWDLWEERWGTHLWTCAAAVGGLRGAASLAERYGAAKKDAARWRAVADEIAGAIDRHFWSDELGRYVRSLVPVAEGEAEQDRTVDVSICGLFMLNCKPAADARVAATVAAIRSALTVKTAVGGLARYEGDKYQRGEEGSEGVPGNPWFVCALWLAQAVIAAAQSREKLEPAREVIAWACAQGDAAKILAEQIDPQTGLPLSVAPLTWSHAEVVRVITAYFERDSELSRQTKTSGLSDAKPAAATGRVAGKQIFKTARTARLL